MLRISYRNRLLLKKLLRIALILLAIALVVSIVVLIYIEPYMVYERTGAQLDFAAGEKQNAEQAELAARPSVNDGQIIYDQIAPDTQLLADIGGYYVTTSMLRDPAAVLQAVQKIENPGAIMLELKSIYGNFYYSSSLSDAPLADVDTGAIDDLISYLVSQKFYVIAVIPAFPDSAFALENIPCGLPLSSGALWLDENGCYWLDPASEAVMTRLTQIGRELSELGIREVVFSDFRFPDSTNIVYHSEQSIEEILQASAAALTDALTGSGTMVSFSTTEADFPVAACKGRLYIPNVDATQVDRYSQLYGKTGSIAELVFLTNSRDTRFEGQAVLRPLLTE